jgi:hypothetical protein
MTGVLQGCDQDLHLVPLPGNARCTLHLRHGRGCDVELRAAGAAAAGDLGESVLRVDAEGLLVVTVAALAVPKPVPYTVEVDVRRLADPEPLRAPLPTRRRAS